jgi:hypothetical protein
MLTYRKLSFAFLLPAAELLVWAKLVVEPALVMFIRFHFAGSAEMKAQQFQIIVPRSNWLAFSFGIFCRLNFHTIMNINLPGVLIGAPLTVIVLPILRHTDSLFEPKMWHTLCLPFFCLPVWWFIGRVVDQLISGQRPRRIPATIGMLACLACSALLIALLAATPLDQRDLIPYVPGLILWIIAFAIAPVGWLLRRRSAASRVEAGVP